MSVDMAAEGPDEAPIEAIPPLTGGHYRYAMLLLMSISVVNYIDRQVINIIAEPIKRELHLADSQLGLLTGLAFGLLYTFLGLPIARLAERGNRPWIIAFAAAVWSAFTVLSGVVRTFPQLALARIGVGFGEAGCVSPSHSLIMDYAPKNKRSSAMALFGLSPPIGVLIGLAFGGVVADVYGWRAAFLVAGAPGLLFAILTALTLPEPRRAIAARVAQAKAKAPSLGDLFRLVRSKRSYWVLGAGITLNVFVAYGYGPFMASFFFRNHTRELADMAQAVSSVLGVHLKSGGLLGLSMGILMGGGGALGTWFGGYTADRLGPADPRRYLKGPAIAITLTAPVLISIFTVPWLGVAFALLGLHAFLNGFWYGPTFAAWMSLVAPTMRATNSALILFTSNLVGLGLGPSVAGMMSDAYGRTVGPANGLRWSLVTVSCLQVITGLLFWMAARTFREDQES